MSQYTKEDQNVTLRKNNEWKPFIWGERLWENASSCFWLTNVIKFMRLMSSSFGCCYEVQLFRLTHPQVLILWRMQSCPLIFLPFRQLQDRQGYKKGRFSYHGQKPFCPLFLPWHKTKHLGRIWLKQGQLINPSIRRVSMLSEKLPECYKSVCGCWQLDD